MTRSQCIVVRGNRLLMVRHRVGGREHWCLPGGRVEDGETHAEAAVRELREECGVNGTIVRQTSFVSYAPDDEAVTFLVAIGQQEPCLGEDPELRGKEQVLVDLGWLLLSEIPERDRTFLWAAGLMGVGEFLSEVFSWGEAKSYPGAGLSPPDL